MPYENEFATYRSIRRLSTNERVKSLLRRSVVKETDSIKINLPYINASLLKPSIWEPELILAIDGSHQEEKIENGFPGAEISYISVASVIIDVAKMRNLDEHRPIDPKEFRTIEHVDSLDAAFPGTNVIIDNEISAKASLRKALFEALRDTRIPSDGESLLDTLEVLLKSRSSIESQVCPYGNDCMHPNQKYTRKQGVYPCGCIYNQPFYSTDALRIHEGMIPDSNNGAMYAEIMQVIERLMIIHILRWMEKRNLLWMLKHTGFVIDGPLAIFGHPASLLSGISDELKRINNLAKQFTNNQDILMIGVEKTGYFVDHFERLDQNENGNSGGFPSGNVALLTDQYIKQNIIYSNSSKPYGQDTYFGRKFFYKTSSGARIVASTPFLNNDDDFLNTAYPSQFPRLPDVLALLEKIVSSRYPHSIFPLISANAEAAIPMNLGSRVLEEMAFKLIKEKKHEL